MEPCEARLVHWENLALNTAFLFQILSSSYGENCPGRISHVTSLRALVALCVLMDAMSSWTCIFLVSQLTSNNKHSMALLSFFQYLWHYSGTISCAISFQAFLPFIPKLQDKMQNRKPGFDKYFYINWRWSLPDLEWKSDSAVLMCLVGSEMQLMSYITVMWCFELVLPRGGATLSRDPK